jgi:hypothetical protein
MKEGRKKGEGCEKELTFSILQKRVKKTPILRQIIFRKID